MTTKVDGDPDQTLSQQKGGIGWPYVVVMDPEGLVVARNLEVVRPQDPSTVLGAARSQTEEFRSLEQSAAEGDQDTRLRYLMRRLELFNVPAADARAMQKGLGELDSERAAELEQMLVNYEVDQLFASAPSRDMKGYAVIVPGAVKLAKQDRVPTGEGRARNFWRLVGMYAQQAGDQELAKRAAQGIRDASDGVKAKKLR